MLVAASSDPHARLIRDAAGACRSMQGCVGIQPGVALLGWPSVHTKTKKPKGHSTRPDPRAKYVNKPVQRETSDENPDDDDPETADGEEWAPTDDGGGGDDGGTGGDGGGNDDRPNKDGRTDTGKIIVEAGPDWERWWEGAGQDGGQSTSDETPSKPRCSSDCAQCTCEGGGGKDVLPCCADVFDTCCSLRGDESRCVGTPGGADRREWCETVKERYAQTILDQFRWRFVLENPKSDGELKKTAERLLQDYKAQIQSLYADLNTCCPDTWVG